MQLNLRLLLLLTWLVGGLHAAQDNVDVVKRFKESLKSVDRVVLVRADYDRSNEGDPNGIVWEIKGADVIASLGETIEIKEFDMECLCLESPIINFYQGKDYRFSMTLHHSHRLRGRDGELGSDAVLTEQSAEKFRAWFAEHGYMGFANGYASMMQSIAADQALREKFLKIFPDPVRRILAAEGDRYDWKAKQRKQEQINALHQSRTALILDCWRGLGAFPPSYGDDNWKSDYQEVFRGILEKLDTADLRAALDALPANEDQTWVGAYRCFEHGGLDGKDRMARLFNEDWLARLAKRVLPVADEYEQSWIIDNLAERPAAATNQLLLEIAGSGPMAVKKPVDRNDFPDRLRMSAAGHAILVLARNKVAASRPIILRQMADVGDADARLALEVALAQFDGPAAIKLAHLLSKWEEVSELAWQTLSLDPNAQIPIETLAALAAKSESYRVRSGAAKKLQGLGLRVTTDLEKANAILKEPRFRKAESEAEIEALIVEARQLPALQDSDKVAKLVLAGLNHRKGLLLMRSGDYEHAAPLLTGGEIDGALYADQAFAFQVLGRFYDAGTSLSRSLPLGVDEAMAAQLARRGYLAFAHEHYEGAAASFSAANAIRSYSRDLGPLELFPYLCDVLAGREARIPDSKAMFFVGSRSLEEGEDPDEVSWPETGTAFLQGKLSEAEVFARIEKQKRPSQNELCEAHFVFSVLGRARKDAAGETRHLEAALNTKAFTNQCYSLALLRSRQLAKKDK